MRPEEKIRQALLEVLSTKFGYPRHLMAIEKALTSLTGIKNVANRRFDVLIYAKKAEKLEPLLLIECKAGAVTDAAMQQVLGYNAAVGAPFVALVGRNQALTLSSCGKMVGGILHYKELLEWT